MADYGIDSPIFLDSVRVGQVQGAVSPGILPAASQRQMGSAVAAPGWMEAIWGSQQLVPKGSLSPLGWVCHGAGVHVSAEGAL